LFSMYMHENMSFDDDVCVLRGAGVSLARAATSHNTLCFPLLQLLATGILGCLMTDDIRQN